MFPNFYYAFQIDRIYNILKCDFISENYHIRICYYIRKERHNGKTLVMRYKLKEWKICVFVECAFLMILQCDLCVEIDAHHYFAEQL